MAEGDNGLGGPPALSRADVRAQIIETIERIVDSDYDGNLYYVEECADAILSLLGRRP